MSWTNEPITVDSRFLLALYAIIPLSFVLIGLDALFFDFAIAKFLPSNPEQYLWFLFIFNLPHIMASLVTYADRDYISAYKRPLLSGLAISLLLPAAFFAVGALNAFFIFIAFYTVYHVLMQQYGISLMLLKRPANKVFQLWKWLSIVAACVLYLHVYRANALAAWTDVSLLEIGTALVACSVPFGLYYFWVIAKDAAISPTSKRYFLATFLIVIASCVACVIGYPFFLVLIPRFIHDATAFTIYAAHDHNRNLTAHHNVIYRAFKPLHISPVILCLPLAVALAWYFTAYQYDSPVVMYCLVVFMLLHYHMEGHMWKRGTPHRQNVSFRIA